MEFWARWKLWTSGGGVDGGKGRIEKPLSFCLVKLYMFTRDVLRLTLGHEIGQSKAKYRCLENIFLRFSSLLFSEWRKAWLDAPYKTWSQNISLRYLPLWYLKQRVAQRTNSFDSFNHLSITLIVWFTGLFKIGALQLSVVVLPLNLVSQCLTIESHCC